MDGRRPNDGHEQSEPCEHCGGTGEVKHRCQHFETIECNEQIDTTSTQQGTRIEICPECESVFKIRYQWDRGTGSDDILIRPGDERRGYSFSEEEADEYREQWRNEQKA